MFSATSADIIGLPEDDLFLVAEPPNVLIIGSQEESRDYGQCNGKGTFDDKDLGPSRAIVCTIQSEHSGRKKSTESTSQRIARQQHAGSELELFRAVHCCKVDCFIAEVSDLCLLDGI